MTDIQHTTTPLRTTAPSKARKRRFDSYPYLLLMPAVLMMLCVNLLPILQGFWMSLLKLNQYTLHQYLDAPFVGLDNYRHVLMSPGSPIRAGLAGALRNTVLYTLVVTISSIVIGLGVALLLNRDFPGKRLARTALMLPWVVPSYVVGTLWGFMWQKDTGIINVVLVDWLHLLPSKPFWLLGPGTFWAIVIPTVWRGWPVLMLIFLAALQSIPQDLYDAAATDGASKFRQFIHITLPCLLPVIVIQFMFQIIDNIYSYNIVSMMFGNGAGHPGEWGDLLMPLLTRQSFNYWLFGQGSAVSFVIMALMLMFVGMWMTAFKRRMTSDA
ncbi:MAG: sugar ABC transporter permease [Burkholderiales bacterium]|nr:sugar ABC transporter permease [Burkholderiales bacterium]